MARGRPRKQYDDATARLVEAMAQYGVPHEQIAAKAGLNVRTMRTLYEQELTVGAATANYKVAKTLYSKAVNGDTTACIFWLKCKCAFSEKAVLDHVSSDGSMSPKSAPAIDPNLFSPEQLKALRGLDISEGDQD